MTARIVNLVLLFILFVAVGYYVERPDRPSNDQGGEPTQSDQDIEAGDQQITLRVWMPESMLEYEIEQFEAGHPNVDIIVTSMENDPRIVERYLNALAEKNAPDLLVMPQRMLGSFSSIDKLADLSPVVELPPGYREEIGEYLWGIHRSLDGSRMFALPYNYSPHVLYYRADLIADAGFPSEPDQLEAYLEKPDNWMALTQAMHDRGIFTTQWHTDLLYTLNNGQYLFDRELNYSRSSDVYEAAYETAVLTRDMSASMTIWHANGQELLRQGKLAMVVLPDWGENQLAGWVPEQAGSWRVTKLPFGTGGIDQSTSKSIAIAMQSEHKEIAAEFLSEVLRLSGSHNWYADKVPSSYLGNQDVGKFYARIVREMPVSTLPTPYDQKAFDIWYSSMNAAIDKGLAAEDALYIAEQGIIDVVSVPLQQLREYRERLEE